MLNSKAEYKRCWISRLTVEQRAEGTSTGEEPKEQQRVACIDMGWETLQQGGSETGKDREQRGNKRNKVEGGEEEDTSRRAKRRKFQLAPEGWGGGCGTRKAC